MPVYEIHQAKTHLSRLIAQAQDGIEVLIVRNGNPVARLVPFTKPGVRRFGAMAGRITLDESFFDPLPEDEIEAWEE